MTEGLRSFLSGIWMNFFFGALSHVIRHVSVNEVFNILQHFRLIVDWKSIICQISIMIIDTFSIDDVIWSILK